MTPIEQKLRLASACLDDAIRLKNNINVDLILRSAKQHIQDALDLKTKGDEIPWPIDNQTEEFIC